jgi:hypothetical protein
MNSMFHSTMSSFILSLPCPSLLLPGPLPLFSLPLHPYLHHSTHFLTLSSPSLHHILVSSSLHRSFFSLSFILLFSSPHPILVFSPSLLFLSLLHPSLNHSTPLLSPPTIYRSCQTIQRPQ